MSGAVGLKRCSDLARVLMMMLSVALCPLLLGLRLKLLWPVLPLLRVYALLLLLLGLRL